MQHPIADKQKVIDNIEFTSYQSEAEATESAAVPCGNDKHEQKYGEKRVYQVLLVCLPFLPDQIKPVDNIFSESQSPSLCFLSSNP